MRDTQPSALGPPPCFACLYRPPAPADHDRAQGPQNAVDPKDAAVSASAALKAVNVLVALAQECSPRYERHRDDLVVVDVSGLERLLGTLRTIGEELRRAASARGARVHVAVAATRMAAFVLAQARPGLTVVEPGHEAAALAPVPIGILEKVALPGIQASSAVSAFTRWGLRTLGELAALPPAGLSARLGPEGLFWRAMARGEDIRPLTPDVPEERFESSLDLDWPIEGLEPLSFVLTRLLEPLSIRLERRDRGAAVLRVTLRLVTRALHARRLELPSPIRDVRALRTLALLDLDAHPPGAAVDRVTVVIDPTPGRVLQHTLFTRPHPTPEQLSTLLARLGALMGPDRVGAPARVDSYRPGAFDMTPFNMDHDAATMERRDRGDRSAAPSAVTVASALRRCRQPVPARVSVEAGRPLRVTTDRHSVAGGAVLQAAGPWRTSGHWWTGGERLRPRRAEDMGIRGEASASVRAGGGAPAPVEERRAPWNRDEWDVALSDGAVYRVFRDRETGGWFIDAVVD